MFHDVYSQLAYLYILQLKSDEGKLKCLKNYSVINGNIGDHLAGVTANIECRWLPRVLETRRYWKEVPEVEWLKELYPLFKNVYKQYLIAYLEETDFIPAIADECQKVLDEMEIVLALEENRNAS